MQVCAADGCPELSDKTYCPEHQREARARMERSPGSQRAQRWYKSARWRKRRQAQLRRHPYCQCPFHEGQKVPATIADHVIPHRGDYELFWRGKLQSLTKQCHDSWAQRKDNAHRSAIQPDMRV